MTITDDINIFTRAAGWGDREIFCFHAEEGDEERHGPNNVDGQVLLFIHAEKALAVGFGFTADGPILRVRAFEGDEQAHVDSVGFGPQLTLSVGENVRTAEEGLF